MPMIIKLITRIGTRNIYIFIHFLKKKDRYIMIHCHGLHYTQIIAYYKTTFKFFSP